MAIMGGIDPNATLQVADTWPLGIGIFDLSAMAFQDRYDADAAPYTSPEVVQRWYTENGLITSNVSEDVKRLFDRSTLVTPSADRPATSDDEKPGSTNIGAIVGGTVGSVVVLTIIAVGVWVRLRRRHRQRSMPPNMRHVHETEGSPMFEADGQETYETEGRQRHELL